MATLLRRALERAPVEPVPERLAEVAEWVGAPEVERGRALRDLLDLYGRIAASRPALRERERRRFPRFSSSPEAA
jgi:hypothetical protein